MAAAEKFQRVLQSGGKGSKGRQPAFPEHPLSPRLQPCCWGDRSLPWPAKGSPSISPGEAGGSCSFADKAVAGRVSAKLVVVVGQDLALVLCGAMCLAWLRPDPHDLPSPVCVLSLATGSPCVPPPERSLPIAVDKPHLCVRLPRWCHHPGLSHAPHLCLLLHWDADGYGQMAVLKLKDLLTFSDQFLDSVKVWWCF